MFRSRSAQVDKTAAAVSSELAILFEILLPDSLEPLLSEAVDHTVAREGRDMRHNVTASGVFEGRLTADLFGLARSQALNGALVVAAPDAKRVLYFRNGVVVAARSNIETDRLGHILKVGELVTDEQAHHLIETENALGIAAALELVTPEAAQWGMERRVWEIATGLFFVEGGHYVLVEGEPVLEGFIEVAFQPMQLAMDGMRRVDEWRNYVAQQEEAKSSKKKRGLFGKSKKKKHAEAS